MPAAPAHVSECGAEEQSLHRVRLFGQPTIQSGAAMIGTLPTKSQELLFFLLLHHEQPHTREFLAGHLWPEATPVQAKKYLRQQLWQLQASLEQSGPPLFTFDREWICLNPQASLWWDSRIFERAVKLSCEAAGGQLDRWQMQVLQEAVELYRGDLLGGWYQEWCLIARERFHAMFLAMLDRLVDACLGYRNFERGLDYALRALQAEPTREKSHRQLMRLYYCSGDRSAALHQFARCSRILESEFNIGPTGQTLALWEQIRADAVLSQDALLSETAPGQGSAGPAMFGELTQIMALLQHLQTEVASLKRMLQAEPARKDRATDDSADTAIDACSLS